MRTHPDFSDWIHRSHIVQHRCGCMHRQTIVSFLRSMLHATVTEAAVHALSCRVPYPHSFLNHTRLTVATAVLHYMRPT